jgi:hypothetical protein
MFSTDVLVRHVGGKKIKVIDTDEIQYATDRNSLRDRFNRLRSSTYNLHNRDMSMAYQASRLELFRDYDVMDMDPIIASALDIYSDECLSGDTLVPLLDGRKMTIKDLYEANEKNFWVYSVDSDGKFVPQKCERVACNGTKQMFEIALDDGTKIKCTSNHMWVKSDGTIVTTENLKSGDSLKILSTKLSNSKFMPGYEMLLEDGKWQYTHRMVAARTAELIEQKVNMKSKNLVIHHNSFDKRNNCPDKLCWMDYTDHRKVHAEFNKKLWSDPTKVHQYKQKTIDGQNRYWTEERRIEVSNRQRIYMNEMIHGMSADERKKMFGVCGSSNGMFNNGDKLSGNKNGRWKNFSTLDMIDIESYREDIIGGMTTSELRKKYNLSRKTCDFLDKNICIEFGCEQTKQIKPIIRKQVLESRGISIKKIKIAANNLLSSGVNVFRKNKILAQELNITVSELKDYVIASKYKGLRDLVLSNNHRVLSIKLIESEMAYDLVNVGETHIYAIETNDGSKLFTHNCLVPSEFGNVLTIRSKNENIKKILNNLFYDILNVEFNMWSWTRNMCKYGDFFLRLEISPEYGIHLVHPISPYELTRVEGSDPKNLNYVKYQHDGMGGGMEYENFEIAHFRLLSDSNFLPYGKSMIEPARRVWKQLSLMEDAMLIHRIMKAPEKRIFSIDVGNIAPSEVDAAMQKIITQVKKVPYIDEKTGDYNLRFNLNNMVEDFYLPVRGGDSGTKIDTLPGMEFTGIDDLEYVRNKMMAALKIPKAFLGYDESISGKATLAAEDVRFARTIGRIQRILVSELTKIAIVHLYVQGYQDASLVDFELELSNPSTIFEQEKLEIWQNKVNLAADMMESNMFSKKWLYNNIFNMSGDDVEDLQQEVIKDKKEGWRIQQITDEGSDPSLTIGGGESGEGGGGGGGDMGGGGDGLPDLGGGGDSGGDDAGGEESGGLPPLEEEKNADESILDEETRKERERGIRPSQEGKKEEYSDTFTKTRGEDILGNGQNKEKSKSDRRTTHIYRGGALSMDEDLKRIKKSLMDKYNNKNKKIIAEEKSIMDESNIIDDDKPL